MTTADEESFPRGNRKVSSTLKRDAKPIDNLFANEKPPKPKKARKEKRVQNEAPTEDGFHAKLNISGTLAYNKMQEGLQVLGCIRHISNFALEIEFPGLTFGQATITNISDPLTKDLNQKLQEVEDYDSDLVLRSLFKVGQFLPAKILSIGSKESGIRVETSINPRDINSEKNHDSFKKGMLAWGSIQSVLDHGYEINLGVKNCRVFLPVKNVDNERKFAIGEPLWCVIHKSESTGVATTLRVSAKSEHIKSTKVEEIASLHDVIPGMQVQMVTEKITTNGIQGKFLDNFFGYVDESQLKNPLHTLQDYQEGKILTAYVLYVEPSTKITHLTLRGLDTFGDPEYKNGDVVSVEVLLKSHNGVLFKFPNKEKGFVTNKRLINSLAKSAKLDITDAIRSKFPPGSKHSCRILDFNHMSKMYICTVEQQLVKQPLFARKDVKLGQLVNVEVLKVKPDGLVVSAGNLKGFVPNLYLSTGKFSENIKKKFTVDMTFKARVLNVNKDGSSVFFTAKPQMVECEDCLTDITNAKFGEQYPGVVVKTTPAGALVVFYGDAKGWISSKELDKGGSHKNDPRKYFFRGQVVDVWVLGLVNNNLMLTQKEPTEFKGQQTLKVGDTIDGKIVKIHKDRFDVLSSNGKIRGVVPVNHLSSTLSLCKVFLKTYKPGDVLPNLLCISCNSESPAIFSRREALAFARNKYKFRKFDELKKYNLIRCSYDSDCTKGIYVRPLIKDYNEKLLIKYQNVLDENGDLPTFEPQQSIVVKILEIDVEAATLEVTARFAEVFDKNVDSTVRLLSEHLGEIQLLKTTGRANQLDLCQYDPGERIDCKVQRLGNQGGCLVTLPNGVNGLVAPHLCPGNVKPGQLLKGIFLSQDFAENYAEICLKSDIFSKIHPVQNGELKNLSVTSMIGKKLLVKNDCIIAVLRQGGGGQLVYIPLFLHENDTKGSLSYYGDGKIKLCICGKVGECLVGMSRRLFLKLEKERVQFGKSIKKRKNSSGSTNNKNEAKLEDEDSSEEETFENEEETDEGIEDFERESDSEDDVMEEESNADQASDLSEEDLKTVEKSFDKKIKFGNNTVKSFNSNDNITGPLPILPGISTFYNNSIATPAVEESSSDEEEQEPTVKKRKKLTPAERAELARLEEERIIKIEMELADNSVAPQSAEQFDRLLLANPNSSELWTRYISFHVSATELDKARSVGKRALEAIDMNQVQEKFNIWIALLHLENMYGSKESFEKLFEDAVKYNDSLQVYLKVIEMLAEAGKLNDMEEKVRKVRNKHKQEPIMWLEVAKVYYLIKQFKDARNLKNAALKSILDKKTQMNLIIRFAIMEFKHGEEDQGSAIFETIVGSDPKKVNVWCTYVDQLVKKDKIEQARKVLERSTCQRLSLRNMKTLFLKFRKFEEQHGTPDSVEEVKKRAQEFLSKSEK